MTGEDRSDFAKLLADVLGFYGQTTSTFALMVWWEACQPFTLEQVRKAMSSHAMDADQGRFAPKPADVLKILQGTHGDRSLVAWGKVLQAMSSVGAYESVVFDDGVIHTAVEDVGGWSEICRGQTDDLPHLQRRFCQAYQAALRSGRKHPPRLVGEYERLAARGSHEPPKPVLVGDPQKCREVMDDALDKVQLAVARLTH